MRQAGRSLPEYRALRAGTAMLEACQDPDLATEITLQPVRRHGVDAAILFSDIVLPLVVAGRRPRDQARGRAGDRAARCARSPTSTRCPTLEPDRLAFLDDGGAAAWSPSSAPTPLIGFAGAPFTLATYLIEGGPSKEHARTKALMYAEPEAWTRCSPARRSRRRCSCARRSTPAPPPCSCSTRGPACCRRADYAERVLPHSRAVFDGLAIARPARDVPRIHFGVGTGELLPLIGEAGADVVGVDWRMPLDEAARRVGPGRSLQGNLDPAVLLADRGHGRARGAPGRRRRAAPPAGTSSTSATACCPTPTPACSPTSSSWCTS